MKAFCLFLCLASSAFAWSGGPWYNTSGGSASFSAIAEDVLPNADNTYDLGSSTYSWQDLYLEGTAYTDLIQAHTAAGVSVIGFAGDADLLQVADVSVERFAITTTASAGAVVFTWDDSAVGNPITMTVDHDATAEVVFDHGLEALEVNSATFGAADGTNGFTIANSTGIATVSAGLQLGSGIHLTAAADGTSNLFASGTEAGTLWVQTIDDGDGTVDVAAALTADSLTVDANADVTVSGSGAHVGDRIEAGSNAGVTVVGYTGDADLLQVSDASVERWAITTSASADSVVETFTDKDASDTLTYDNNKFTFSDDLDAAGPVTGDSFTADANGDVVVSGSGAFKGAYVEAADGTTAITLSDSTALATFAGSITMATGKVLTSETIAAVDADGVTIKGYTADADLLQVSDASVERWAITTDAGADGVTETYTDDNGSDTLRYDAGVFTFSDQVFVQTAAAGTLLSLDDGQEGGTRIYFASTRASATDIDAGMYINSDDQEVSIIWDEGNSRFQSSTDFYSDSKIIAKNGLATGTNGWGIAIGAAGPPNVNAAAVFSDCGSAFSDPGTSVGSIQWDGGQYSGAFGLVGGASATDYQAIVVGALVSAGPMILTTTDATLASDSFAVTNRIGAVTLICESGTSDTLATITGGTAGQILYLKPKLAGDTFTITDGTGRDANEIHTAGAVSLDSISDVLILRFNGLYWDQIGAVNND